MFMHYARKLFLLSIFSAVAICILVFLFTDYVNSDGPLAVETNFEVKKDESLISVSKRLKNFGIIGSEIVFLAHIKVTNVEKKIRFGEYLISKNISIVDLANLFTSGMQINHAVTIPEGWTSWEIFNFLNSNEILSGKLTSVPKEGSLAPDTYFVTKGEDKSNVINRMKKRQETILREVWQNRKSNLPLNSPREVLILASIIEKETSKNEERELIASVLVNRINRGMRLQVDPTVIYGITKGMSKLERNLSSSDLKQPTKYNTYMLPKLPQGPICNPGIASIKAAANPKNSEFLYFVADGEGGHLFSEDLSTHINNVRVWKKKTN